MVDASEELLGAVLREHGARLLANLSARCGDLGLAEDALQDAAIEAVRAWQVEPPANPAGWLAVAARRRLIDHLRKDARHERALAEFASGLPRSEAAPELEEPGMISDERLTLMFLCAHPDLAPDQRMALTLRAVAGVTTGEIARAYLVSEATIAQRLVRARARIRARGLCFELPSPADFEARLDGVLEVIYLVFNEGYRASSGPGLLRPDLATEAIRLARLVVELAPAEPEAIGLLALLLLQNSRAAARTGPDGELVTLEEQDRSLWDDEAIREGRALCDSAMRLGRPGPYQVQAAIAAIHSEARTPDSVDWHRVVLLYDVLISFQPGPVVELNRAAAVAMASGPAAGLALMDREETAGALAEFPLFHAARADLFRRLGRHPEASDAYRAALALTTSEVERRYYLRRLGEVGPGTASIVPSGR